MRLSVCASPPCASMHALPLQSTAAEATAAANDASSAATAATTAPASTAALRSLADASELIERFSAWFPVQESARRRVPAALLSLVFAASVASHAAVAAADAGMSGLVSAVTAPDSQLGVGHGEAGSSAPTAAVAPCVLACVQVQLRHALVDGETDVAAAASPGGAASAPQSPAASPSSTPVSSTASAAEPTPAASPTSEAAASGAAVADVAAAAGDDAAAPSFVAATADRVLARVGAVGASIARYLCLEPDARGLPASRVSLETSCSPTHLDAQVESAAAPAAAGDAAEAPPAQPASAPSSSAAVSMATLPRRSLFSMTVGTLLVSLHASATAPPAAPSSSSGAPRPPGSSSSAAAAAAASSSGSGSYFTTAPGPPLLGPSTPAPSPAITALPLLGPPSKLQNTVDLTYGINALIAVVRKAVTGGSSTAAPPPAPQSTDALELALLCDTRAELSCGISDEAVAVALLTALQGAGQTLRVAVSAADTPGEGWLSLLVQLQHRGSPAVAQAALALLRIILPSCAPQTLRLRVPRPPGAAASQPQPPSSAVPVGAAGFVAYLLGRLADALSAAAELPDADGDVAAASPQRSPLLSAQIASETIALLRALLGSPSHGGWGGVVADALLAALSAGLQTPTLTLAQLQDIAPAAAAALARPLGPVRIAAGTGAVSVEAAEPEAGSWAASAPLQVSLPLPAPAATSDDSAGPSSESRAAADAEAGDFVAGGSLDGGVQPSAFATLRSALAALAVLGGYAEPLRPGALVEVVPALLPAAVRAAAAAGEDAQSGSSISALLRAGLGPSGAPSDFGSFSPFGGPSSGGADAGASPPLYISTSGALAVIDSSAQQVIHARLEPSARPHSATSSGTPSAEAASATATTLRFELAPAFSNLQRFAAAAWAPPAGVSGAGTPAGSATFLLPVEALQAVPRVPVPLGALTPALWRAAADAASVWGLSDYMALPPSELLDGPAAAAGSSDPLCGGFSARLSHPTFTMSPTGGSVTTNGSTGRAIVDCPLTAGVWTWEFKLVKVRVRVGMAPHHTFHPPAHRAFLPPHHYITTFLPSPPYKTFPLPIAGRPRPGDDVLRRPGPAARRRGLQVAQLLDVPRLQRLPLRWGEERLLALSKEGGGIPAPSSSSPPLRGPRTSAGCPRCTPATRWAAPTTRPRARSRCLTTAPTSESLSLGSQGRCTQQWSSTGPTVPWSCSRCAASTRRRPSPAMRAAPPPRQRPGLPPLPLLEMQARTTVAAEPSALRSPPPSSETLRPTGPASCLRTPWPQSRCTSLRCLLLPFLPPLKMLPQMANPHPAPRLRERTLPLLPPLLLGRRRPRQRPLRLASSTTSLCSRPAPLLCGPCWPATLPRRC